jgi:hypothetical protein
VHELSDSSSILLNQTYKLSFDKEKQKNVLVKHMDINIVNNIVELGLNENIGNKFFTRFSDYSENTLYFMYITLSNNDQKQIVNLVNEQEDTGEQNSPVFLNFAKTIINKKDTSTKLLVNFLIIL